MDNPLEMSTFNTIIILILGVAILLQIGVILLQIYLSKKENKWAGLIIPIISLCISLVAVLNTTSYITIYSSHQVIYENGISVQETPETETRTVQSTSSLIHSAGVVFLFCNIPTVVLLAIYFGCSEKQRQRKALEKMQAQDLE